MTLEESLRALAADDAALVPPHVDAAVMAAWDDLADRKGPRRTTIAEGPRRTAVWGWSQPWPAWVAACAGLVIAAVLVTWSPPGENAGRRIAASPAPLMQDELVLVPELAGTGPLTLMRVRMTRREFSRLGVPISNPEGDGLIDVEVLVGEDGVARSIRRAVTVNWTGPNPPGGSAP
jgi:hypothetical protein